MNFDQAWAVRAESEAVELLGSGGIGIWEVERFGDRGGSVAPAVTTTGGGGVDAAGRVEGGPLKDGDLSLGFGYAPRVSVSLTDASVPPGSHAGLWGRPTGAYAFHRDAGAALGVGLAGTQHEIFRDILSRREDFGSSAYVQQQQQHQHQHQHQLQQQQQQQQRQQQHHHHQQQQQQQHHHHHQHQHQHGLQGVQRQLNIAGEGPNYGDAGRGEAESSSSGSVDKGGHQQQQQQQQHQQQQPGGVTVAAGVEPWAARALREEVVVRGMDVQPLNESQRQATPQHNPQAVLNVEPVQQQAPPAPPLQVVGSVGSTACQECGNQAKKDCSFQRCRTCCKSRDFDCATHVKSTWVPASKRRERQAAEAAAAAAGQPRLKPKRARGLALAAPTAGATTSMTTTSANSPRGSDINSGHPSHPAQARTTLPPEVRAQALFKCVRVTGVEDGENDMFAYQATVKIGGHIFKGVLYDQGLDLAQQQAVTSNPSDLQLGAGGGGVRGSGSGSALPSSSPLLDPSGMYAPGNSLLGGEDPRGSPWFS